MKPQVTVQLLRLGDESRQTTRRLLRELLAARLDCSVTDVAIRTGTNGKPSLVSGGLEFSLAHSGDWCALAFSADCPVGVDVELIHAQPGLEAVVAEFFPPEAQREFTATPVSAQPAVFFRWWTRLEAAVKACGGRLDDAHCYLSRVRHKSFHCAPGLALCVATRSSSAPIVELRPAKGLHCFKERN